FEAAAYVALFCQNSCLKLQWEMGLVELDPGQCVLVHFPIGDIRLEWDSGSTLCAIRMTEAYFNRLRISNKEYFGTAIRMSPAIRITLNSLSAQSQPIPIRRIFLESTVLHLIQMILEELSHTDLSSKAQIRGEDADLMHYAKSLIEENIRTPYSLMELSRTVGLNDFKLKKGFKKLFGTTVFGYLSELRMQYAWKLLLEDKRAVKEVADEVGYKNPHHFSAAFKKHFGMLPSELNR